MSRGDHTQTLAVARLALEAQGAPMHYAELAELMLDGGWAYPGRGQPAYHVYAVVYQDVKERGDESPFRFLRRGVFGLEGQELTQATCTQARATGRAPRQRVTRSDLPRLCGCCQHLQYRGVKELTLDSGECERYQETGRPYNRTEAEACPFWVPRPAGQVQAEVQRQGELRHLVGAINRVVKTGKMYGSLKELIRGGR